MDNLRYDNVIDVIYQKYPCIKKYVDDNNKILATTKDACELILRSPIWKNYLLTSTDPSVRNIATKYSESIKNFDMIVPNSMILIGEINRIYAKFDKNGNPNSPITGKEKQNIIEMAKSMNIKMRRTLRVTDNKKIFQLISKIMQEINTKGFKSSAVSILNIDKDVRDVFQKFLHENLTDMCYIPKKESQIDPTVKEVAGYFAGENILGNMNLSEGYIRHLINDNLAIAFPGIYEDSDEKMFDELGSDLVPSTYVLWEERPLFPKYAMLWLLSQGDYLVEGFVAAKEGLNTITNIPDYDVYGQLICTRREISGDGNKSSGGAGKLLLIATILMGYQYKVNYIFIQAFQGVLGVQAPLYNRLGFNLKFNNELLKRKTAFYQWSGEEKKLDELHKEFLEQVKEQVKKGTISSTIESIQKSGLSGVTDRLVGTFRRKILLQPMWLYLRGYETQYACNLLLESGFDYQKKTIGYMGTSLLKWASLGARTLGWENVPVHETQEKPSEFVPSRTLTGIIYDTFNPKNMLKDIKKIESQKSKSERRRDGADCKKDEDCLSDYCFEGSCKPYPYEQTSEAEVSMDPEYDISTNPEYQDILRELALRPEYVESEYAKRKRQEQYMTESIRRQKEKQSIMEMELLTQKDEESNRKKKEKQIQLQEKAILNLAELIKLKEKEGKEFEKEEEEFQKRLKALKDMSDERRFDELTNKILYIFGVVAPKALYNKMFGKK